MAKVDMSSLNVLVIDDEPFISRLIMRMLRDLGVRDLVTAKNGAEGISKVQESMKKIDLIICDLEMPKMNGFEFVKHLRTSPDIADRHVPVLILTGHSQGKNVHEMVGLGIHGFLSKPVSKVILEKRITTAMTSPPIDLKALEDQ